MGGARRNGWMAGFRTIPNGMVGASTSAILPGKQPLLTVAVAAPSAALQTLIPCSSANGALTGHYFAEGHGHRRGESKGIHKSQPERPFQRAALIVDALLWLRLGLPL